MCNEIATTTKKQCKLEKNKTICSMHKKKKLLGYVKEEIKNLNKTIEKKNSKIKYLDEKIDIKTLDIIIKNNTIENLIKDIKNLTIEKSELEEENNILKEENAVMQEDFNNYQFIKRFEAIKYNLKKYVNIKDHNQIIFFCMQRKNHKILEDIMGKQENYYTYFNKLRHQRNKLSHWYY
jgi:hypothetical protein